MCLFGFEGAADKVDIDGKGIHFDESLWSDEYVVDVEELYVFIIEELVDVFPYFQKAG